MKKRILSLIVALFGLAVCFAGCSGEKPIPSEELLSATLDEQDIGVKYHEFHGLLYALTNEYVYELLDSVVPVVEGNTHQATITFHELMPTRIHCDEIYGLAVSADDRVRSEPEVELTNYSLKKNVLTLDFELSGEIPEEFLMAIHIPVYWYGDHSEGYKSYFQGQILFGFRHS